MRRVQMAELAERTGLAVATIKYYLREGLLPPGRSTSATRAEYDESHVRRLRLVRALSEVAKLRLDVVRDVLAAVDDDTLSWHQAVGRAHTRLGTGAPASPAALGRVTDLVGRQGWQPSPTATHRTTLAQALDAMADLGQPVADELLDVYAEAATRIAEHEVGAISTADRAEGVHRVVIGTLLLEPALLAIRRMAQEEVSRRTRS